MDEPRERLVPLPAAPPKRVENKFLAVIRGLFTLIFATAAIAAGAGALIGYNIYQKYSADLPTLDGLRTYQPPMMTRVYAGDDQLMSELATERRIFVPFVAIPDRVKQAFIAAEDQNFYTHSGIDPVAIFRAAVTDVLRAGGNRRPIGASTITQQVARNMVLGSNEPSFERKVKEALTAMRIEKAMSKQRILELYLNQIYLGQSAYGVVAAAETYFNKPLDQLTIAQAAMLGALPKSPSNYNPFHEPAAAKTRRDWVIDRMLETHMITAQQAADAHAEPLIPAAYRRPAGVPGAEWFAEDVRRALIARFGEDQTQQAGFIVHTSLDPDLQAKADAALRAGLMAYDHGHGGWRGPIGRLGTQISQTSDWADALAHVPPPAGMLSSWGLAVVLEVEPTHAVIGWRPSTPGGVPMPRLGSIAMSDLGWARPALRDGAFGPFPRKVADVLAVGDIVMVEPAPAAAPLPDVIDTKGRHHISARAAPEPTLERVLLRQIPRVEGALVSLDPRTGRVLAMCGGWSAAASNFNRADQALRQPGSSFKPFVYLTAMEQGISPSAQFLDEPITIGDWSPHNYELNFGGPTSLHVALEQSYNLVTVRVAEKIGMDSIAKTAIDFHLFDSMPRVLPAALGAVETTVLREAGAYASIEQGGRAVIPSLIDSVQDRDGRVLWRPQNLVFAASDPTQPPVLTDPRAPVSDPDSTFQVVKMMEGVVLNGTGVAVGAGLNRPIAGKTGTSQDYNDAWFAGFTPDLVTIVWVGFDSPQTLGDKQTGAVVAGPIWHNYTAAALAGKPALDFRIPDGVTVAGWDCGTHQCIDAFKATQVPGASAVATDAGLAASGIIPQLAPDGSVQQMPPDQNSDPNSPAATGKAAGTGVDSGVGGLY